MSVAAQSNVSGSLMKTAEIKRNEIGSKGIVKIGQLMPGTKKSILKKTSSNMI